MGRGEERLRRDRTPVDQQRAARTVPKAKPPDVHRPGAARADHAPQAQIQAEAAQDTQPGGQPVDLHVPVHRRLPDPAGRPALGLETLRQPGDRLLQALPDRREMLLITGDQRRIGLGGQPAGKIKHAGSQRVHVISSDGSLFVVPRQHSGQPRVPLRAVPQ